MSEHFRRLERMYATAPINAFFRPSLEVSKGSAVITFEVRPEFHHAAGAVHGSVYFKALDDSAFFAVNSLVEDCFVLTASFTVYLTRPVTDGAMRAEGRVVSRSAKLFVAESVLLAGDREVARGSGTFMHSRIPLTAEVGYA